MRSTHTTTVIDRFYKGAFCIFCAVSYLIVESIVIHGANCPLNGYFYHTVSEFGVPIGKIYDGEISRFSPLFLWMDLGLVFAGITFIPCYRFLTDGALTKNERALRVLSVIVGISIANIGIFHQGTGARAVLHLSFATVTFVGGNLLLLLTGIRAHGSAGKVFSATLGASGLTFALLMLLCALSPFSPWKATFERLSIYPLVLWELSGGLFLTFRSTPTRTR